jgi:FkbM family methyltransferase
MRLTDLVQKTIRHFGYDIVRYRTPLNHPFDMLDALIQHRVGPDFFFVQVGAHDGVRMADPLHRSILKYNLQGLLIEPLPDLFQALQRNYASQPGVRCLNCAIAPVDGEYRLYRVRPDAPLAPETQGLASFDRRNLTAAKQGVPGLDAYVEAIRVPARNLGTLLREQGSPPVSLLVIDTEGYDAHIVNSALDSGIAPKIIVYEHIHLTAETQFATLNRLKTAGYRFLEIGMDTYAVRETP